LQVWQLLRTRGNLPARECWSVQANKAGMNDFCRARSDRTRPSARQRARSRRNAGLPQLLRRAAEWGSLPLAVLVSRPQAGVHGASPPSKMSQYQAAPMTATMNALSEKPIKVPACSCQNVRAADRVLALRTGRTPSTTQNACSTLNRRVIRTAKAIASPEPIAFPIHAKRPMGALGPVSCGLAPSGVAPLFCSGNQMLGRRPDCSDRISMQTFVLSPVLRHRPVTGLIRPLASTVARSPTLG
jgi:hypothetical protein